MLHTGPSELGRPPAAVGHRRLFKYKITTLGSRCAVHLQTLPGSHHAAAQKKIQMLLQTQDPCRSKGGAQSRGLLSWACLQAARVDAALLTECCRAERPEARVVTVLLLPPMVRKPLCAPGSGTRRRAQPTHVVEGAWRKNATPCPAFATPPQVERPEGAAKAVLPAVCRWAPATASEQRQAGHRLVGTGRPGHHLRSHGASHRRRSSVERSSVVCSLESICPDLPSAHLSCPITHALSSLQELHIGDLKEGPFREDPCPLEVALPPEKVEGHEGPGQLFNADDGERAANHEVPRGLGQKRLNIDALQCDVSVEEDNRQEWTFTLYDFDNSGKVTREDMSSLMHTIYEVVDASVNHSSGSSKTLRVKLTVSPEPSSKKKEGPPAGQGEGVEAPARE
ncbi:PREDICTED: uncharacterized protein LOC103607949 [Galeopterus variegatus]|uniref:Protein naked cuticle homolog n=1 Tax=Galeopterus variegatus TaxID=482537 RepID=A0ABM0SCN2_GALVR|nr:PREDICTED: uncharacterized protein LOC103607949 [Galeopterus variegatus]